MVRPLSPMPPGSVRPATGRRRRRRRRVARVVVLLLVIGLAALAVAVWRTLPAVDAARDARTQLRVLQDARSVLRHVPSPAEVALLDGHTVRLVQDLQIIQQAWGMWRGPALFAGALWPPGRGQAEQVDALLDYGIAIGQAGHLLGGALSPVLAATPTHKGMHSVMPVLVARLADARPALGVAAAALDRAVAARRRISPGQLPAEVRRGISQIDELLPEAPAQVRAVAALPAALGADGPRDYLLCPQNSLDLRASGGWMATVGILHVDKGKVSTRNFESSYRIDNGKRPDVDAPDPWRKYAQPYWYFRDVNWSADFPTNARLLEIFYTLPTHRHLDGVIAFDSLMVPQLISLTGPVSAPRYKVTLTPENAFNTLDQLVNAPGGYGRAAAVAVNQAVFNQLVSLPNLDSGNALSLLSGVVRSRHVLLFANDSTVQQSIRLARADGAIDRTRGDYLFVVDTNTVTNKINDKIQQTISYHATIQPDRSILAEAMLTYTNTADRTNSPPYRVAPGSTPTNHKYADYGDFVRVFVPAGATLLATTGLDEPWPAATVHNKTQFSGFFGLASHQARTITFRYRVPANAAAGGRYSLLVQKQSGTAALPLRVSVSGRAGILVGNGGGLNVATTLASDQVMQTSLAGGMPHLQKLNLVGKEPPVVPGSQPEIWVRVPVRNVPAPLSGD